MLRFILPSLLLLLALTRSYSQQVKTTFTIQGVTDPPDTGRMFLMPVNTEDYYPFHGTMVSKIVDGKFSFTDSISYPTAYMLGLKHDSDWTYLSNPFFVEPGIQALYCNIDTLWTTPAITNRTMQEFQNDYSKSFASVNSQYNQYDRKRDSLFDVYKGHIPDSLRIFLSSIEKDLTNKSRIILLSYVRKNPGSYVALWKLIGQFSSGYYPFYDSLYDAFSDTLRHSYTGRILAQRLATSRVSCIGCRFPDVKLASINDLAQKASILTRLSKYTLIDIWFSHCTPCIDQFATYKEVYSRFRSGGFQLIGVSTDTKDQIPNWRKIISRYQLPWPQYLDEGGTIAKQLSIISWPSNFLVNENGIIIQRNISPQALDHFLNANIRSK